MSQSLTKPASLALLLINIIPLLGVIFWNWNIGDILYLYWAENVVFGLVTIIRILSNKHPSGSFASRIFMSAFFSVHYGIFCFGHAAFIFGGIAFLESEQAPLEAIAAMLNSHWFVILGFFLSHLISFFFNDLRKDEVSRIPPQTVMIRPYRRIFILQITIIFGGIAVAALGSPVALIAILVIAKTVSDYKLHLKEHRDIPQ